MLPISTTVRLLPKEVDPSIILTMSGLGALGFTIFAVLRGYDTERMRRFALLGTVLGGTMGVGCFIVLLTGAVR